MKTEPNVLIKNAVFEAMDHISQGSTPTEALKKVAQSHLLNANYIQRVGEVINVTAHQEHFKTAGQDKRAEEFPIADIPGVVKSIYGDVEPTAKQVKAAQFIHSAKSLESLNLNKRLTDPKFKEAYLKIMGEKDEQNEMSVGGVLDKAANYVLKLAQEADRTATDLVGAEREFTGTFSKVMQKFARDINSRTSFEEFESQVFATHGEAAMPYVDELYKSANLDRTDKRDARGVHDAKYITFEPCEELQSFDRFLKAAAQLGVARNEAAEAKYNYDFEKASLKEAHVKLAQLHEPVVAPVAPAVEKLAEVKPETTDPVLLFIEKKAMEAKLAKCTCSCGKSFGCAGQPAESQGIIKCPDCGKHHTHAKEEFPKEEVKQAAEGTDAKKAEELSDALLSKIGFDLFSQLSSVFQSGRDINKDLGPSKSNQVLKKDVSVDNVTRRAILQELIMTDPILSKVEPQKVIQAYEQLLSIAPHVAMQKEIVRAMLRTMVQGQAMSPYDANQAIEADLALMKHKLMQHGQHREVNIDTGKGR